MRQLTFLSPGKFEWRDVAAPHITGVRQALVRPLAVARCDLDLYIAIGAAPFGGPFAFGHEAVGEVVDAGDGAGVKPGDRVVVPFQISCGGCDNCKRGYTNSCSVVPLYSAYGLAGNGRKDFGGALADLMLVPFADHMLVPLPEGVDPVVAASACDNIADGWRGVAPHLATRPGASVLVVGGLAQSVGIYAAGSAVALGAGRVLYLDDNAENRKRAAALGADVGPLALGDGREASEQFEIVVEAAGAAPALAFAVRSTAANGMLTSVSMHFDAATPVPLSQAYYKGLTFHTGRVQSRPLLPDVLGCIACGKLHPEHVTHRVTSFDEAGDAMADPGPKLVFVP
jgi:threonine dehydrogenase-like Zn-dependent dehydrogenase